MPEGDTIWRTARTLRAVLAGHTVTAFQSPLPQVDAAARRFRLVGQTISDVESRGKHLLIRFSGGPSLHTHQRMTGSWHVYRRTSRWRKRSGSIRAIIETAEVAAICFGAPVVELLPPRAVALHSPLARLGPDLLSPHFDEDEALRRLWASPEMEIGVALMDQTALAGIGNVYKSEVLFLCGVYPFLQVRDISEDILRCIVKTARTQLLANLGPGMRRTRPETASGRLWVYRRAGRACLRCGACVRRGVQGEQARSTYWCPRCQERGSHP